MGKTAFLFPGQGSQYVGMAKDIYENIPEAKKLFDNANELLGFDISKIMFEGPLEKLKQTEITQPAIFLHSYAVFSLLKNLKADMSAGHSLGEYTALVAAGAIDFSDGLKLVRFRGELMQEAGRINKGTMAAVIGLSSEKLEEICAKASDAGVVRCANFNSPGQIVISGASRGVYRAMQLAKENGARLARELVVSGAFHSPLMKPAEEKLEKKLNEINFKELKLPVYSNVTAGQIKSSTESKELLIKQLTSPVRWQEIIENMIKDGAEEFVEIGPGKVLQGLVKRIAPEVKFYGIDKIHDLEKFAW